MKFFLLTGGFLGFVLSYSASWNAGNAPASVLCDAVIGCLAGALLFRGLHVVLMMTLRSHLLSQAEQRRAQAAAAVNVSATI
jgi:hypothetical protein